MRESTSSKEPLSSPSDHERSFERTRDSYIACINRSLEHAFEFLSETGYASAGYSDAERVESRSEDELDRSHSDFIAEINVGLKQRGVEELKVPKVVCNASKKEITLGQLWGPSKTRNNLNQNSVNNLNDKNERTEYLNTKNRLQHTEEEIAPKTQKKIIIYQHVKAGNSRKNKSKSMENIGPRNSTKNAEANGNAKIGIRKANGLTESEGNNLPNNKENAAPIRKLHDREDSGYESKAEMRNGVHTKGDIDELLTKKSTRGSDAQRTLETNRRETTPYLTTEREIFKQILTNAKESEQIGNKQRRRSRSMSNLDLRRAASKVSLGPTPRQRPPAKTTTQNEIKGFKKFRESFRRTTSYFMPQKFAFQEEKESDNDYANALEFEYHCMRNSRDGNEPITSSKNPEGKKKGFFRNIFERKKSKPRLRRYFKSTEAISQSRWQSRENLSRNERKTKNDRPISMLLIDKVKDQTESENVAACDLKIPEDEKLQIRKNSFKGSRFRRCESLRSITSTNYSLGLNDAVFQTADDEISELDRIPRSGRNRPMSVHGVLFRTTSLDASERSSDYHHLHRVLRNRLSYCSLGDNAIHNHNDNRMSLDRMSLDSRGDVFASSSPRKNDDITDWLRGLQYSSVDKARKDHDCFIEEQEHELIEEERLMSNTSDDGDNFCPETRIVNGQKQTYL